MAIARESLTLTGILSNNSSNESKLSFRSLPPHIAPDKALISYLGSSHLDLSADFQHWVNTAPTGVQIDTILFANLPPGAYIVQGFSPNALSEALNAKYSYKTLFQAPLHVDRADDITSSKNTVRMPLSITIPQSTFELILRVTAYPSKYRLV
jgi:hypothetical protein